MWIISLPKIQQLEQLPIMTTHAYLDGNNRFNHNQFKVTLSNPTINFPQWYKDCTKQSPEHPIVLQAEQSFWELPLAGEHRYHRKLEQALEEHEK